MPSAKDDSTRSEWSDFLRRARKAGWIGVLGNATALVFTAAVASLSGAEAFGVVALAILVLLLGQNLVAGALERAFVRLAAEAVDRRSALRLKEAFRKASLVLAAIGGGFAVAVVALPTGLLDAVPAFRMHPAVLDTVVWAAPISFVGHAASGVLAGLQVPHWISVSNSIVRPSAQLLGFWLLSARLPVATALAVATAAAFLLAGVLMAGIAWTSVVRLDYEDRPSHGPPGWSIKTTVRELTPPALLSFAAQNLDLAIIAGLLPANAVGAYALAKRFHPALTMPLVLLGGMTAAAVARAKALGSLQVGLRSFRLSSAVVFYWALPLAWVAVGWGGDVMAILGDTFQDGGGVLAWFAIAALIKVSVGPTGSTLVATGHNRVVVVSTIAATSITLLGGVALTLMFGAIGAASAVALGAMTANFFEATRLRAEENLTSADPLVWGLRMTLFTVGSVIFLLVGDLPALGIGLLLTLTALTVALAFHWESRRLSRLDWG